MPDVFPLREKQSEMQSELIECKDGNHGKIHVRFGAEDGVLWGKRVEGMPKKGKAAGSE